MTDIADYLTSKPPRYSERITIPLTPEQRQQVERAARRHRVGVAEFVRAACQAHVEAWPDKARQPEAEPSSPSPEAVGVLTIDNGDILDEAQPIDNGDILDIMNEAQPSPAEITAQPNRPDILAELGL